MYKENARDLDKVFKLISEYILKRFEGPVVNYKNVVELKEISSLNIPNEEQDFSKVISEIENYLKYSVKTIHPNFSNQLYGGFSLASYLGDIISSLTNTSMATFEIAPMATLIERKLIETMNEYVGYSDGEGIMLTGGSNANLMAMLIARHKKDPELKQTGVSKKALVAFISEEAHYSFDKGCIMMGFGRDNLILVKADDNGTMDIVDLEKKIIDQKEIGKQPFFIGATAGTTVYGAFDPMDEISDIAKKYECWFHIDGAWGGSLLLSNKAKVLLKGCEKSDSFTWDAHKMMGVPIISSFFLCRHKGVMRETNTSGGSDYIFHETENSSYDTGPQSLQCGRKVDALKVWLNFIHHGRNGMEKRIDCLIEKTKYLRTKVIENPNTELMLEPSSINLCFRFINSDKLNEYNLKIREALVTQGEFLTNYARDKNGSVFFRHIFTHPETTNDEIDKFFERLNILADEFK